MRKLKFISILIMVLFLSGCWDRMEIEDIGYVAVIGIDDGDFDNLRITFQITNPQVGTSAKFKLTSLLLILLHYPQKI